MGGVSNMRRGGGGQGKFLLAEGQNFLPWGRAPNSGLAKRLLVTDMVRPLHEPIFPPFERTFARFA